MVTAWQQEEALRRVRECSAQRPGRHVERVERGAAALLTSWWSAAGGYGVSRDHLDRVDSRLALVALDAVQLVDEERNRA